MKLYNTLTRQKEEFVPIEENNVSMYVCGPTVYDFIHIGNARPYVVFDTVRRYLTHKGYNVTYVQNFTDIDDKIIKKANDEGVDSKVISERYIEEALKDARGLNVIDATVHPKVTEEIPEIIEMIEELIEKGFAYEKNGSVYFDTYAFNEYGKLSRKNIDDLMSGARIEVDEEKKNPVDFILWKPAKENEPYWESPWGNGRPGWHIECSVMSKKYLGEQIDIHAGGEDLIFPHHENEIAQSEAVNGKKFANYWLHNGFININSQKMSKSKGNFFTLREISEKYTHNEIRFFILSGHYRSPINFSEELMNASSKGLERITNTIDKLKFVNNNSVVEKNEIDDDIINGADVFVNKFYESMDDDFNTADAISNIFELVKYVNINVTDTSSKYLTSGLLNKITELMDILGLTYEKQEDVKVDVELIESLIEKRTNAKKDKDFKLADEIRNELLEMGIVIEDTRGGVKWKTNY